MDKKTVADIKKQLSVVIKAVPTASADAVAGFLGRLGVKGMIGCDESCVLANYYHAALLPFKVDVSVDGASVEVYTRKPNEDGDATLIVKRSLSDAQESLVVDFDSGLYPWLKGPFGAKALATMRDNLADEGIVD